MRMPAAAGPLARAHHHGVRGDEQNGEHHREADGTHQQAHVAPHGGEARVERLLGAGLGRRTGVAKLIVQHLGGGQGFMDHVAEGDYGYIGPRAFDRRDADWNKLVGV